MAALQAATELEPRRKHLQQMCMSLSLKKQQYVHCHIQLLYALSSMRPNACVLLHFPATIQTHTKFSGPLPLPHPSFWNQPPLLLYNNHISMCILCAWRVHEKRMVGQGMHNTHTQQA